MKVIILSLILSLVCIAVVEADDGLNSIQNEQLRTGCTYVTNDIQQRCITELT